VSDVAGPRIPVATYRLQLGPDLTFEGAADLLGYLAALGISDCYTSPFFESCAPASHGYDVCDHNQLRGELGGERGFARLAEALRRHDMGLLIDMVPNHMGIAANRNAWWLDVLENGPASPYADFFDIDWAPLKAELAAKVLLPILGDHYGAVLDRGELRLDLEDGRFRIRYYETVLPVGPRSSARILGHRLDQLQTRLGPAHEAVVRLSTLVTWFATLPPRTERDPDRRAARQRDKEIGRQKLVELLADSPDVAKFVEENVRQFNGTPGDPRSFDLLDQLLTDQAYRVAFWRVAGEEINYRRFFDINELAAVRMEDPRVFAETHRLVLRLVGEGIVTGIRVDHPDGLYAPAAYFRQLQRACFLAQARRTSADGGTVTDADLLAPLDALEARSTMPPRPFYVVAEKILGAGEPMPAQWAVQGATGYEFLNLVNGIFVDRAQARAMEEAYARFVRERVSFAEMAYRGKLLIMETSMASELHVLGHRLNVMSEKHRSSRDFTLGNLTHALRQLIASFPVYRTYVGDSPAGPTSNVISAADRDTLARAVTQAKGRTLARSVSIFDWLHDLLSLKLPAGATDEDRAERLDFVMRFQQTTGPVTAKGVEDTALYRYHRLVSLNEVGGDPSRFGTPLAEFHTANAARVRTTPHALSSTSTHDTKRSEDVRARINVLSDIPTEWRRRVGVWHRLNRRHRTVVDGTPVPGPHEEYLLYQTLVGAWPIDADRLRAYTLKALREAKERTSWVNPHERYDDAVARFAEAIVDPERSRTFLGDFMSFQARVAAWGLLNSLAQVVIKVTAPGVPDFYQGMEILDLSLVDPDNRRPVDWGQRRRLLDELTAAVAGGDLADVARDLWQGGRDAALKLYVTRQSLHLRRERAPLFATGDYVPLEARGPLAEHVCAFARHAGDAAVLTVVPRLLARRGIVDPVGERGWGATAVVLPSALAGRYRDGFTGQAVDTAPGPDGPTLPLARAFEILPVTLLERTS
jgi:(1->4)-alpha-D-glucan 1-alpha-D-glucosylmutase